jgi:hypothetical protein
VAGNICQALPPKRERIGGGPSSLLLLSSSCLISVGGGLPAVLGVGVSTSLLLFASSRLSRERSVTGGPVRYLVHIMLWMEALSHAHVME